MSKFMAREEIIEKLNNFLIKHNPFDEESQVVYLMVEIRKVIDREKNSVKYPLLKFYTDWIVHTEKDHITTEIRQIMEEMYETAKAEIINSLKRKSGSPIIRFAYMEDLYKEMEQFLKKYNINTALTGKEVWLQFVQLLVKVLQNQPIKNPIDDVVSFYFASTAPNCVHGIIIFSQPINGFNYYQFANVY